MLKPRFCGWVLVEPVRNTIETGVITYVQVPQPMPSGEPLGIDLGLLSFVVNAADGKTYWNWLE